MSRWNTTNPIANIHLHSNPKPFSQELKRFGVPSVTIRPRIMCVIGFADKLGRLAYAHGYLDILIYGKGQPRLSCG